MSGCQGHQSRGEKSSYLRQSHQGDHKSRQEVSGDGYSGPSRPGAAQAEPHLGKEWLKEKTWTCSSLAWAVLNLPLLNWVFLLLMSFRHGDKAQVILPLLLLTWMSQARRKQKGAGSHSAPLPSSWGPDWCKNQRAGVTGRKRRKGGSRGQLLALA